MKVVMSSASALYSNIATLDSLLRCSGEYLLASLSISGHGPQ